MSTDPRPLNGVRIGPMGGRPEFYQHDFSAAVAHACGRAFVNVLAPPAALAEFRALVRDPARVEFTLGAFSGTDLIQGG